MNRFNEWLKIWEAVWDSKSLQLTVPALNGMLDILLTEGGYKDPAAVRFLMSFVRQQYLHRHKEVPRHALNVFVKTLFYRELFDENDPKSIQPYKYKTVAEADPALMGEMIQFLKDHVNVSAPTCERVQLFLDLIEAERTGEDHTIIFLDLATRYEYESRLLKDVEPTDENIHRAILKALPESGGKATDEQLHRVAKMKDPRSFMALLALKLRGKRDDDPRLQALRMQSNPLAGAHYSDRSS